MAATPPISELLTQGITALTTLKARVEGGREGGEEREKEGKEEEEAVEKEVKILSQTKWVRGLFEVGREGGREEGKEGQID